LAKTPDFKGLIVDWRPSYGYEPIFKAMEDWKIDTATFLDLHHDPKGREVGVFELAGFKMLKFFRL